MSKSYAVCFSHFWIALQVMLDEWNLSRVILIRISEPNDSYKCHCGDYANYYLRQHGGDR